MRALRIWLMKRRAKSIHNNITSLHDRYDCGSELIDMVTGGKLTRLRNELSEVMLTLKNIDPKYPK